MTTQLTETELANLQQLLQEYEPAKEAIAVLQTHDGKLDESFDQLWQDKNEPLTFAKSQSSLWEVTLDVLRNEICGDEGFRAMISDYTKNPKNAPLLMALIAALVSKTHLPLDATMATIVILYLLKVGLNIFCKYTEPQP